MEVSVVDGDQVRATGNDVASDLSLALFPEFCIASRYRTKEAALLSNCFLLSVTLPNHAWDC